ncbi:hypothetical protein FACS1894178_1060 [Bacteroidia bacterium]|nr:hypothetical protein FACS1894178_1060 [Bacteroidia bacterium]
MKKDIVFIILFIFFSHLIYSCCIDNIQDNKDKERKEKFIPFILTNFLTVDVYFNDSVKARMIIDNGCPEIIFGETYFHKNKDKLGLKAMPNLKSMHTFAFHPDLRVYIAEGKLSLSIMDTTILCNNESMYYVKSKPIKNFAEIQLDDKFLTKDSLDGILPLRHLSLLGNVEINFNEKKICFPKTIDSSYARYNYRLENKQQIIEYPIRYYTNDTTLYCEKYSTLLDLGTDGGVVILNNNKINKIKSIIAKGSDYLKYIGDRQRMVKSKKNLLGNDSIAVYNLFAYMFNIPVKEECIIGTHFLKNYNLIFDYDSQCIYMKANAKELNKPDINNIFFGIGINVFNKIIYIEDDIQTELMLGDILIKINDKDLINLSEDDFRFAKKNAQKGQVKSITVLRNGTEITINLEE